MKVLFMSTIAVTLFAMLSVQDNDSAGYRGIVPLKSTRTDVERVLGRPVNPSNPTYDFSDRTVRIQYSKYGCTPPERIEGWPVPPLEGWNVPPDTVLAVHITMRKQVSLKSLKVDLKGFTKERGDSDVQTHFKYVNRERGLTINLNGDPRNEFVRAVIYEPESKYSKLRCGEQKVAN